VLSTGIKVDDLGFHGQRPWCQSKAHMH